MDEPVELYAITGRTEDDDHAYETPHVSTGNKYENLKINTLAEDMTDPSMVSDDTTRNTNKVHNLKPDVDAAAFRKLQIAFVIVCSVLLTIIIISSLTIGVLIHKLNTRLAVIESSTATIEANTQRLDLSVNAQWTDWLQWSGCSVTCGSGQMTRQRLCLNPSPSNGGSNCTGSGTEQTRCQATSCPVNAQWTDWLQWSGCGETCGSGQMTRQRLCLNHSPSNGGSNCTGSGTEQTSCQANSCPVDGQWTDWLQWSGCSVTYGLGRMTRQRLCLNPSPSNGGSNCTGSGTEQKSCQATCCPAYRSAFATFVFTFSSYNSSSKVLIFPSTTTNIGHHYSYTTGQFTAQYGGIYVFILNLYKDTGADRITCYIRKNGEGVVMAYVPAESEWGFYESSASTVVHLDPGDKVDVGACNNPSGIHDYTSFIGFLLQAD